MEVTIDIINYLYIQALDIWELDKRGGAKKRTTQIINVNDNHLCADQVWEEMGSTRRRGALGNVNWGSLMEGRVILLGDFNTQSPGWNLHCGEKCDGAGLKALIDGYSLFLNNEPGEATKPTQRSTTSIGDLTLNTPEVVSLDTWIIDEEHSMTSDHELIVFDTASLENMVSRMETSQKVTG